MTNNTLVAVILINYNKSEYTIKCVNSLLESDYQDYIVIVVDNSSSEEESQKLKLLNDKRVLIYENDNKYGYVGGVNYGLSVASTLKPEYYLIMNNDTIIDKNAIRVLVKTALKYDNRCIVSGKVYNMDEPDTLQYIGQWCRSHINLDYPPYVKGSREKDVGQYDREMEMGMLDDIFWLLPNIVFQDVGYYSTYFFMYGEQNDYALRAVQKGFKLIYTPNAKLWHYRHLTTANGDKYNPVVLYWQTYSTLVLASLHLNRINFMSLYMRNLIKLFFKIFYNYTFDQITSTFLSPDHRLLL